MRQLGAATLVSLFGAGLLVPNVRRLVDAGGPPAGLALAGLGTVLSVVLIGAGYLLVRAEFAPLHTLRVAGWATLGTVVLGLVLVLISLSDVALPLYAGATLLSVSTFAHVLIGVRDVQRIRAEELAREREKFAVLNRIVRHNLRHEAQRLLGVAGQLQADDATEGTDRFLADIEAIAGRLTDLTDQLDRSQRLVRDELGRHVVDVRAAVEDVVTEYREAYPGATLEVDVPAGCRVLAGDHFRQAVAELVENALVHSDGAGRVAVEAEINRGSVTLRVSDDGPGIPEQERAVVTREADITQLSHSQGLGLWFVRWTMDAYDGEFTIERTEPGTTVTLQLPRASG